MTNYLQKRPLFGLSANTQMQPQSFDFESWFDMIGMRHRSGSSLYQVDTGYVLQIPLPGIKPDDLDISVDGRTITVSTNFEVSPPEGATPIWQGDVAGEIRESFTLPSEVYSDESSATYENGILTIALQKAEKTHKIKVS